MQGILTDTIESLKDEMFNDAKTEFLDLFKTLKVLIMQLCCCRCFMNQPT